MAVKTRANFKTDKNTDFADSPAGNITAAELRNQFDHLADSALFPEDSAFTTLQTTVASVNSAVTGKTLLKHNLTATTAPTITDNAAQGYAIGSRWKQTNVAPVLTWELNKFNVSDADWVLVPDEDVLHPVALLGDYTLLDNQPEFGSAAKENDNRYAKPDQLDAKFIDAQGSKATPRPEQYLNSQVGFWANVGSYDAPDDLGPWDVFYGPPQNVEFPVIITGTSFTPAITEIYNARPYWANNTSALTFNLPSDSAVSAPVGWCPWIRKMNTGDVIFQAIAPVTLDGISGRRKIVAAANTVVQIVKTGPNAYRSFFAALETLPAVANVTIPSGGGVNTLTQDANYWYATILNASGNVVVTDADVPNVRYLLLGAGGSGGRSTSAACSGGGGSIPRRNLDFILTTGSHAYAVAPAAAGAGGAGISGGNSTFTVNGTLITSEGGGAGRNSGSNPGNGGNAGGSAATSATVGYNGPPASAAGGGFAGGRAWGNTADPLKRGGGGGGGGGGAGGDAGNDNGVGGAGGLPFYDDITGVNTPYAAGGSGDGGTALGTVAAGINNYGSGSHGVYTVRQTGAGNSAASQRGALIIRFPKAFVASVSLV